MIGYMIVFFLILGEVSGTHFLSTPDDPYMSGLTTPVSGCVEKASDDSLNLSPPNRLEGFKLTGTYICERTIFEYGERDSFAEYVIEHSEARAKGVAQALRNAKLYRTLTAKSQPLEIEVRSDDLPLGQFIKSVFTHELTVALGPKYVSRANLLQPASSKLLVTINRLQDPQDCLEINLSTINERGAITWQAL
jgi:hypothetical protein